ncbi:MULTISPECIES: AraC family transcriptional regulator [Actinokineospora]|uniref:AraC family transcriptional regulator n=1 Tax=Actinokineospora fastidiosa TaxID=1816 RepID=A0A918LG96_9PSEU|nr:MULTISPECIES: AraC family transcriptional regulator [Actinokineospora]UVS77532.1 HTH-type transcriptional repressor of iron protein A [Actinokineospora sp. UTMC 2448]GGS42649.1 AraC family transcriptional regulator [Actinokineospora fastidiosa]
MEAGFRLRFGGGAEGIERFEASLLGAAFSTHRHDTYAIGMTLSGVQTFRFRGERRQCLPGEWHILHPDEPHDGAAGTDAGFRYRIFYLDPALVQSALGGAPLPFVADPVVSRADPIMTARLADIDDPLDDLAAVELTTAIADLLRAHAAPRRGRAAIDIAAMTRVRSLLIDDPTVPHSVAELERVAGCDRWSMARQFRAAFGTSPTRFRTLRRLDIARGLIRAGRPLSEVAVAAGFADQAHLTRMFKGAFGLTPAAWRSSGSLAQGVDHRDHVGLAVAERHGLGEQRVAGVQQR